MAKLAETSEILIMPTFMAMNLEKMLAKALYFCLQSSSIRFCLLSAAFSRLEGSCMRPVPRKPAWLRERIEAIGGMTHSKSSALSGFSARLFQQALIGLSF